MGRSGAVKRVLFLTVYPPSMAYTRLRGEQFRSYFELEGMELRLWSLVSAGEVGRWFSGGNLRRFWILVRGLFRLIPLVSEVRRAAVVVVLREVLPFGPPLVERIASRKRPLIWDVDDAIWKSYPSLFVSRLPEWLRKTGRKYETLCRLASRVWAGSDVLAEWCRRHNREVRVIPTVVDVPEHNPQRNLDPVVGWIGSPSTGPFLEQILPALESVDAQLKVVVVGSDISAKPKIPVEVLPWSEEAERSTLERISVGLYPIDESHPLAEGKAGFKAILYMSQGIPSVVTPTATNASIVRHEVEGLHARSLDEWTEGVRRLLTDRLLWESCSRAAHERAASHYSLQHWGPLVATYVRELLEG